MYLVDGEAMERSSRSDVWWPQSCIGAKWFEDPAPGSRRKLLHGRRQETRPQVPQGNPEQIFCKWMKFSKIEIWRWNEDQRQNFREFSENFIATKSTPIQDSSGPSQSVGSYNECKLAFILTWILNLHLQLNPRKYKKPAIKYHIIVDCKIIGRLWLSRKWFYLFLNNRLII